MDKHKSSYLLLNSVHDCVVGRLEGVGRLDGVWRLVVSIVLGGVSKAAPPTQPGNIPCNNRRCKTCNILIQSDSFTSPCTGSTHKIRFEFKCTTRNLVYLIQCRRCGLQYVGETGNPLHTRMNSQTSEQERSKNLLQPTLLSRTTHWRTCRLWG